MKLPKLNLKFPDGRRLNKRRLIVVFSVVMALIVAIVFFSKTEFTAFTVKEETSACINECDFEEKACENAKIFECSIGEDGCKHKVLVEECPEGGECSVLKKDECYVPEDCDGDFHTCISDVYYKMCKNGKTVEGADMKKCPTGLMCNRDSKDLSICIEKDY